MDPPTPRSDHGVAQSLAVAERLRRTDVDAILHSPKRRAVETAGLLGDHLGLRPEPCPLLDDRTPVPDEWSDVRIGTTRSCDPCHPWNETRAAASSTPRSPRGIDRRDRSVHRRRHAQLRHRLVVGCVLAGAVVALDRVEPGERRHVDRRVDRRGRLACTASTTSATSRTDRPDLRRPPMTPQPAAPKRRVAGRLNGERSGGERRQAVGAGGGVVEQVALARPALQPAASRLNAFHTST